MSFNSLAGDSGITQPTIKKWISALETTYICIILQPHFKNFNKDITKAPKVFFMLFPSSPQSSGFYWRGSLLYEQLKQYRSPYWVKVKCKNILAVPTSDDFSYM